MTKKLDPYEELGVDAAADAGTIKKAYRKRAKETHPDRGGSQQAFERVNQAMTILSDPDARDRYDRTGSTETRAEKSVEEKARGLLSDIVAAIINGNDDGSSTDLVGFMQAFIGQQMAELQGKKRDLERKKNKAEKMATRFKRKNAGDNLMARVADAHARSLAVKLDEVTNIIAVHEAATKILLDYTFDVDKPAPPTFSTYAPRSSSTSSYWR